MENRIYSPDGQKIDSVWHLIYPEHSMELLLIPHARRRDKQDIKEVARIERDGLMLYNHPFLFELMDPYYKKFEPIKISDMFKSFQSESGSIIKPRLILIDGATGIGKTTLCKEIAYQWAKGELLKDTKIVFLLFLRDPAVQNLHDLNDLIQYFFKFEPSYLDLDLKQCVETLERDNSDITILLDGYDELKEKGNDLLIDNILQRKILKQCRIVVTSRPIASEKLQKFADVRVEVLGLTDGSKKDFIQKELPKDAEHLLSYLHKHRDINNACYMPLMMSTVVHIFKEDKELPTNQSEIYEQFVVLAFSRCLQKLDDKLPKGILTFDELPIKYQIHLKQISEFAFNTIESNDIIFSDEDIERLSYNLSLSIKELDGLGLLKETEKFSILKNRVWYNFLHMSIHEFLAAFYLNKFLELSEQFKILEQTFWIERYSNVWVMFAGLQQNVVYTVHQPSTYSHIYEASNAARDQMKLILLKLHLLNFFEIRNININNISQLLCCKNNKDDLQTDVIQGNKTFDSLYLLFAYGWIKLFVSLCSVVNSDELIEMYLLDKNTKDNSYHQIVAELKENRSLSVMLISSNTLIGYRCNYHQLMNAINMINKSLKGIILRNCLISDDIANVLSLSLINCCYLQCLIVSDCIVKSDQQAFIVILQALMRNSLIEYLSLNNMTEQEGKDLANVVKNNSNLVQLGLSNNNFGSSIIMILQALTENSKLEALYLNKNNMSGKVAKYLATVIKSHPNLKVLGLENNNLGPSATVILKALAENSNLIGLNLNSNNMTGHVTEYLAQVIKNNSNLEQLGLSDNSLGLSSATLILQALKENSKLKVLHLSSNNMTGQVAEDLANVIKNNSGLEELYLNNNDLRSSGTIILQALEENSKLKALNLNNNNMTSQVAKHLANVIKNNSGLEELYLYSNDLRSSATVILQALKKNSKLKALNLGSNNMSSQVAKDLANVIKNNSGLEELYLFSNDLRSSATVILQALEENSKLKVLNLNNNNMTSQVAKHLANVIKNNSGLEELYLYSNDLRSSATVILQALKKNSKLKALNLGSNNMSSQVANDLANVIKNNSGLKELYLYSNDLRSSATVILQALEENSKLKVLNLSNNNMTSQVARDLANVIKNNSGLEELYLYSNDLRSSATVILQALEENSKLKVLNLSNNNMTSQVARDLANVIKNNSGLEKLYLHMNDLKSSATVILQALKEKCKLNELNMSNNFLIGILASQFIPIIKSNPLITNLWLHDNVLQNGLIDIAMSCNSLTNLKVMGLSCNSISHTKVVHLASVVSNINSLQVLIFGGLVLNFKEKFHLELYDANKQTLMLQNNSFNDHEILETVYVEMWRSWFVDKIKLNYDIKIYFPTNVTVLMNFVYIEPNVRTTLSMVKQSKQQLSELDAANVIISLTSCIKSLKALDLGHSNIKIEAAIKLATALNCNNVLEQLWLRGNVLGADGAAVILTSLQNISTLRILDLSYNNISSTSANGITAVINSNQFLEQLWLDGNKLMTTGVVTIASVLKKHSNLLLLSLSNNGITEDAAEEISAIVNSNTLLGGLLLCNNQLKSIGTYEIAKSLGALQFLHILELTNNCIDVTAADELALMLSNCLCLRQLYLGNNNLETKGAVKVCQALKYIQILRVLSLSNNNITTEAASEICNVISTNTNLGILLLGGNDLQTTGVLQIADAVKNNILTMQLLSLSDNNINDQVKEDIKVMLCDECDLKLYV